MAVENNAIIEDLMMLNGVKNFSLNVAPDQVAGIYTLAGNASLFDDSVTLKCEEYPVTMLAVDLGDTATFHNNVYTISLDGSALEVELKSYKTSATAEQLT